MTTVKLFAIPGDAISEAIAAKLRTAVGFHAEIYACPREIANLQPMPFLQIEGGEKLYGQEAIETFLGQVSSSSPQMVP